MQVITIDNKCIGPQHPPLIVAELSDQHGGDLQRALHIIELAAQCGADAIKFQAYTADNMTLKNKRLYAHYQASATPYAWFPELFACAREHNLIPFAAAFGIDAVEMLAGLDTPAYQIASFESVDLELIQACAMMEKPLFLGTGLCNPEEIQQAITAATKTGNQQIVLLKCNCVFPTLPEEVNLLTITSLQQQFQRLVGYTDQSLGTHIASAACALGACVIEKPLIESHAADIADTSLAASPAAFSALVRNCQEIYQARGSAAIQPSLQERQAIVYRRSLYASQTIPAGEKITREKICCVRPGLGLPPKEIDTVVKCRAKMPIAIGTPLSWDLLE
jgi:sialic acid synthase SpsE